MCMNAYSSDLLNGSILPLHIAASPCNTETHSQATINGECFAGGSFAYSKYIHMPEKNFTVLHLHWFNRAVGTGQASQAMAWPVLAVECFKK